MKIALDNDLPTAFCNTDFINIYKKIVGNTSRSDKIQKWIDHHEYKRRLTSMARKIKIDDNTYECPACNYRWSKTMGMADLSFDEDEHCPCCPDCGELIEDGDDYE